MKATHPGIYTPPGAVTTTVTLLKVHPYSLEGQVALRDHLSNLGDDVALGVGHLHSLLPDVDLAGFAVLPGLLRLPTTEKSMS